MNTKIAAMLGTEGYKESRGGHLCKTRHAHRMPPPRPANRARNREVQRRATQGWTGLGQKQRKVLERASEVNVSWKESTLRRDMRLYRSGTGTTRSFPSSWETETEITWFLASPSLLKTRTSDTPVTSQLALRIPSPAPSSGSLILILKETSDAGELSLSDEVLWCTTCQPTFSPAL